MAAEATSRSPEFLNGWKEIAAYLGIDKSTAQRYAKQRSMPVRYLPGARGTVVADVGELDAWLKAGPVVAAASIEPETLPVPVPVAPSTAGAWSRRHWLRYSLAGCAAVGVAGVAANVRHFGLVGHQEPTAYRVEGATLIVSGAGNAELWRYTFPVQLSDALHAQPQVCLFRDLDGDGKTETLFSYYPVGPQAPGKRRLVCFNDNGSKRWEFVPGKPVRDRTGQQFGPPYWPANFEAINGTVVVSSVHHWGFPTQVAVLDGKTGQVTSEYWHRGHLTQLAIARLGNGTTPTMVLAGVNDAPEYKCATLITFDPNHINGSCRNPQGAGYFQNLPLGTELQVVFFPKTELAKRQEFNRVREIRPTADGLTVVVAEGIDEVLAPSMIYEFDRNLQPLSAIPSGEFQHAYLALHAQTQAVLPSPASVAAQSLRDIQVFSR